MMNSRREKNSDFVHLHVHSNYSLLRGADTVPTLCSRAAEFGPSSLALTDRNGLYGAVPFQRECERHGLQPIFGAELVSASTCCVALAINQTGYGNLCRVITALHRSRRKKSFDLAGCLTYYRAGLIIFSLDEPLLSYLRQTSGPENLYVEICPDTIARSWKTHLRTGLPLLATNNVWFAQPDGFGRHQLLTAINLNTSISALADTETARLEHWLKPPETMTRLFADIPEAVTNTRRVAEQCTFRLQLGELRLPRFPFTDGQTSLEMLRAKTEQGIGHRYGAVTPAVLRQVERELNIIREMGYADYFLIVADIVDAAKRLGIPTCGRGSAANSVVAYALELTHVEPLSNNLYFERFLNRGRSDCPDVDIDFAWDERDRIIDWVYQRYGADRVAMISTHVSFAGRGAVREIAKVWGVPPKHITRITKQLPSGWDDKPIFEAARDDPRSQNLPVHEEPWRSIFTLAEQIHGYPKHLGMHAGGIVIAPGPLTDYVPLQPAAKELESGKVVVTQWDMYPIEDAGLVKIDLLGNRSLAVISDTLTTVEENTGTQIDYTSFDPTQDEKTKNLVRRGETMACFYIESPSMRSLLLKLDCHTFDGLVAASSIVRPGIASSGMMQQYVLRSHFDRNEGRHDDSWYLHPLMREALEETFGVMAYQEDVLKVAMMVARMSPEDSDGLRKAMSKKRDFVAIEKYRRQFITGALVNGCSLDICRELWRQIESFSGYSFCKAHSASYALVSYQAAYLRAHHPAEFMAAVMSNHGGYYSTLSYISECRRMGLRVLPPCVNRSKLEFTGTENWVRVGLGQLRNVRHDHLEALLAERKRGGPFLDFGDFLARVGMPANEVETMIRAGAFDTIAGKLNRPQLLQQHTMYRAQRATANDTSFGLFGNVQLPPAPRVRDYTSEQKLAAESETLGLVASVHPLVMFADRFSGHQTVPAEKLRNYIGRTVNVQGWQVTRKRLRTKQDEPMAFVSFEDTTSLYETVVFPREYRKFAPIIPSSGPFLVTGEVTEDLGVITITVTDLKLLAENTPAVPLAGPTIWSDSAHEEAA